jgi:LEA14-like dessication related protein
MPQQLMQVTTALLGALALAGCSLTPHFETPRLSIVDVQVVSTTLWEQHLKVSLRVQNPNDVALSVKGIEYTLDLAGERFASGVADTSFVVPALGEAQFDTSLTTNMTGALLKLAGRGPNTFADGVDYRLAGTISLASGWVRSVPFDEHGSFKLQ